MLAVYLLQPYHRPPLTAMLPNGVLPLQMIYKTTTSIHKDFYLMCNKPHGALSCRSTSCTCESHLKELSTYYDTVMSALLTSAKHLSHETTRNWVVPGWNDIVKESHEAARLNFLHWRRCGSPRSGPEFDDMKRTRATFKRNKRFCDNNKQHLQAEKFAIYMLKKDHKSFWKNIAITNNSKIPSPTKIDNCSGSADICNMWHDHYKDILNSVPKNHEIIDNLNTLLSNIDTDKNMVVYPTEIGEFINSLKSGKSPGHDRITSEHLKYAHESHHVILSLLFTFDLFIQKIHNKSKRYNTLGYKQDRNVK